LGDGLVYTQTFYTLLKMLNIQGLGFKSAGIHHRIILNGLTPQR
jgi:hypothetical protein